jgi:manganese oxidase
VKLTRREMILTGGALLAGGSLLHHAGPVNAREVVQDETREIIPAWQQEPLSPGENYPAVITPNGVSLEYRIVDGVKVYHLIAQKVRHEFAPGLQANCWGYNNRVHGPTIEAVEGDRVRIYVTNKLPAPTTIHWHGVILPSGMDGVGGLSQKLIRPGETFKYEWTFHQHGTLLYHSHHDEMTQIAMGLAGMLIVHPRDTGATPQADRDFAMLLSEWEIPAGAERPNPNEMVDFNILTINARAFPGTAPLIVQQGDRVRFRFGNLSAMSHHPIHLHGHAFRVTETDGGRIPDAGQWPETTVLVPVGSSRTVEFVADNPGDWALHCHMTHHVMNQMGHGPNMVGFNPKGFDERMQKLFPDYMTMGHRGMDDHGEHVESGHMAVPKNSIPMIGAWGPHDYITMGGMFTIMKVRRQIDDYDKDPGWYRNPPGTESAEATREEMQRDGIRIKNT